MTKRARVVSVVCGLLLLLTTGAQTNEPVDLDAIEKIKAASKASQVMDIAGVLTNTHGARLTKSPGLQAAGEYARKKLLEWKLTDVRLETFNFGNGWSNDGFTIKVASDPSMSLRAYAKPWTVGTNGPVTAEVVEGVRSEADLTSLKGTLKGKFVLVLPAPPVPPAAPPGQSLVKRFTDEELTAMAGSAPAVLQPAPAPAPRAAAAEPEVDETPSQEAGFFAWVENALSAAPAQPAGPVQAVPRTPSVRMPSRAQVTRFYFEEGVAGMIEPGPTRNGAFFAITDTGEPNSIKKDPATTKAPPQIVVAVEEYAKLSEMIRKGPVSLQVDIRNTYQTRDQTSFNVVADIKGADKADELVVLGAHLDTWHLGKGATDNAAGVAVVMEAMRILKTSGLPMRRTVRLGLWTGEEQGLLGSMAFVDKYFFRRPIRQIRPEHAKLSVYFNVDHGTGAIRGVYMQGNDAIKPIFAAWMEPFRSMGMTTLADRSVGGSDHAVFSNIGLPAFQFIQDPIEYDAKTHHSDQDTFDKLIREDLVKNATIVASWAYLAANREELLPRKPLPRGVYPAGAPVP